MTYGGLLHSVIPGSKSAYDSPRHFVVSHDLLRLPMPRHSLCALCSLTIELCFDSRLNFEIVVIYPKFFLEYLTRFLICIYFHCSVFKILRVSEKHAGFHCRTLCFLPQAAPCSSSLSANVFAFSLREQSSLIFHFV